MVRGAARARGAAARRCAESIRAIEIGVRNDPDADILRGPAAAAGQCGIALAATSRHPDGAMNVATLGPHASSADAERLAQRAVLLAGVHEVTLSEAGDIVLVGAEEELIARDRDRVAKLAALKLGHRFACVLASALPHQVSVKPSAK